LADGVGVDCQEKCLATHAGSREGGLNACVAGTDYDYVVLLWVNEHLNFPVKRIERGFSFGLGNTSIRIRGEMFADLEDTFNFIRLADFGGDVGCGHPSLSSAECFGDFELQSNDC
jgi:hypothetical protein